MDRPAQLGLTQRTPGVLCGGTVQVNRISFTPALLGFRTLERWLAWVRV